MEKYVRKTGGEYDDHKHLSYYSPTAIVRKQKSIFLQFNFFQAEDEWKEYDEEKKDYSNLKIETLKVESDEEEAGNDDEHEINEDGEKVPKKEGGVWSKGKAEGTLLIIRYN